MGYFLEVNTFDMTSPVEKRELKNPKTMLSEYLQLI